MKRVLHIGSTYTFALLFIAAGIFHVIEPSGFARMSGSQRQNSLLSILYSFSPQTYLLHVREYHFQVKKIQNKPCYG